MAIDVPARALGTAAGPAPPLPSQRDGRAGGLTNVAVPTMARWAWQAYYVRTLLTADAAGALVVGAVAFSLRFGPFPTPYSRWYLLLSVLLPAVWLGTLALNGCYESRHLFDGNEEYQRVFRAGLALAAAVALISYGLEIRLARGYVLVALPLLAAACVLTRLGLRKRLHWARTRGHLLRRVLVVGHAPAVTDVTRQLRRERYHGMAVVGACLPTEQVDGTGWLAGAGIPVYGTLDGVAAVVRRIGADTVIVLSCPELPGVALRRLAWQLERDDVDLIVASALLDVAGSRTTIRPVDGLPMLHVEHPHLTGARRVVKDAFDRVGALVLLATFGPVMLAIAALIRFGSAGPALFRQVRVGRDGQAFPVLKFRTMYVDAPDRLAALTASNEYDGVLFKIRDDPRVTPVGRWLRRFSLDELPQLVNVLRGEMSLVGPRPPLPSEVAAYPDDMHRRLVVKPGMTGLWQVSGRSDLPWEEAVRLDLRYVENWSLSLDLVILLRTLTAVARASGAY